MNEFVLKAIGLSILPIAELRGGIPYAILHEINPIVAYFICVSANILAFPIVYFFLEFLHPIFMKVKLYQDLFEKIVVRTRKKVIKNIDKWGFWGLMIFVMIPLPVTGAHTGSFAAWLFGINKSKAFMAVSFGVIIAGVIVTFNPLRFFISLSLSKSNILFSSNNS